MVTFARLFRLFSLFRFPESRGSRGMMRRRMEGGACPLHQAAASSGLARLLPQELVCVGLVPLQPQPEPEPYPLVWTLEA